MAAPVWLLSVDLQTKTASFTTGLADAAKKARSTFADIGAGAEDMGTRTGHSFGSVRANLGLIDNTIRGAHAQAMADLVRMFSESRIVMAALPIAATAAGIVMLGGLVVELVEKLRELRLVHEKLADDMLRFQTTANDTYRGLEDKLLNAERRVDELRNDHMAALQKQLELIDHQSMEDLQRSLEALAKTADTVFKDLSSHWYSFWAGGSAGAKHSFDEFEVRYKALLSTGSDTDAKSASDMLHSKLDREMRILEAQRTIANTHGGDTDASFAARLELQRAGAGYAQKDIEAQQQLVSLLEDQVKNEAEINKLKSSASTGARLQESNEAAQRRSAAAREGAQSMLQMAQESVAAAKATADARLATHRASLEEQLASDSDFAARERDIKLAANQAEIAALDKSGKDYENQLKALKDKQLEIRSSYDAKIAELTATENVAAYHRDIENLITAEREKIQATREGSAERLQAIDAALAEEAAHNLQQTEQYRNLLAERAQMARRAAEEDGRDKEAAGIAQANLTVKIGQMQVAAEQQQMAVANSLRIMTRAREVQEQTFLANALYAIRLHGLMDEVAALDKGGKDYDTKLQALHNKEKELVQQHENDITAIKQKAEIQRNQSVMAAEGQMQSFMARELTQSIMGHQTWGHMILSIGDQVVSGMIRNALMSNHADEITRLSDAKYAARKMFKAGTHFPFPMNLVMPPVLAAGAFATVMAFATGTDKVAGVGRGDVVPAMLTPGEGIVPGGVMDGLRNVAQRGGFNQRPANVVHFRPTYHIQTIDGDGWNAALEKHADQTQRHIEDTLRRLNK